MMKHVHGRVIVKADQDGKNWHTFGDGTKIRIERGYNNLDRKHTEQVLGEVVSAEHIPTGAMVLFHHNCIHAVNQVFNSKQLSGEEVSEGVHIYSFAEEECYLWKMYGDKEWNPTNGFATALYIFKPYKGVVENISPEKIKDVLYLTSGSLKGTACRSLRYAGMPIIFLNEQGVEETIVRIRHWDNEKNPREEIIATDDSITEKINNGELLVGLSPDKAFPAKIQISN